MFHRIKSETSETDTQRTEDSPKQRKDRETGRFDFKKDRESTPLAPPPSVDTDTTQPVSMKDMEPKRMKPFSTGSFTPGNTEARKTDTVQKKIEDGAVDMPPVSKLARQSVTSTTSTVNTNKKDYKSMTESKTKETSSRTSTDQTDKAYIIGGSESGPRSYVRPAPGSLRSGGYPGSYASSVASYASTPASSSQARDGSRRLTIGAGITMSGEIESCDYLLVEGTVEAALKGAQVLEIAESGTFYGTVEIQDANISGRFEGDLLVHGRLTLAASAMITGSITYTELEVEAGAIIDGRLTPASAGSQKQNKTHAPQQSVRNTERETTTATMENTTEPRDAANAEGGLFSKTVASE